MLRLGYPVLIIMTILSLGLFVYPTIPFSSSVHVADARVASVSQPIDNFSLTGCALAGLGTCTVAGWNGTTSAPNPTITVHQYDKVKIKLTTADTLSHQFWLDVDKDTSTDVGDCPANDICSPMFPPNITETILNVTAAPGNYQYFCSIHPDVMLGTFMILPQATVGGTIIPLVHPTSSSPTLGFALLALLGIAIATFYRQQKKRE